MDNRTAVYRDEIAQREIARRLERYDALVRERRQLIADKAEAVRLLKKAEPLMWHASKAIADEISAFLAKQEAD